MILENGGGTPDLQTVYDNGNEIDLNTINEGAFPHTIGPITRVVTDGVDTLARDVHEIPLDIGFAVSGFDPSNGADFRRYGLLTVNQSWLTIKGSGFADQAPPAQISVGISGFPYAPGDTATIRTLGNLDISATSGLFTQADGDIGINAAGFVNIGAGGAMSIAGGGDIAIGAVGDLAFGAFGTTSLLTVGNASITSLAGSFTCTALSKLDSIAGTYNSLVGGSYNNASQGNVNFAAFNGSNLVFSASGTGATAIFESAGNLTLHAFVQPGTLDLGGGPSGVFHYEANEHQTWHIKTGYDPIGVTNPIMHSGQICQLIDSKIDGQTAFNGITGGYTEMLNVSSEGFTTVTHNLAKQAVVITVTDVQPPEHSAIETVIIPQEIRITTSNAVDIYFTSGGRYRVNIVGLEQWDDMTAT
jgi:hypothetical protein